MFATYAHKEFHVLAGQQVGTWDMAPWKYYRLFRQCQW